MDPNTDPLRKYYIILDLGKLSIELRVLTVYSNSHSQNLTHFLLLLQEQSQEDLPGILGMPEVYQALPSAGLSLPEFQHLVDSLLSHRQEADLKNWVASMEMGTTEMRMKNKV